MVHRLKVQISRRADLGAVGPVGPVGHEIDAELALGRLDGGIDLPRGNVKTLGVKLEMVDERLHRGLHLRPRRRGQLAARQHIARFGAKPGHRLQDDPDRFPHLGHPAQIAVITVAVLSHRHLEVEFIITFIGLRPPQVPCQARTPHHHARKAPVLDLLFRHHADIDVALLEDAVLGQKPVDVVQHPGKGQGPGLDIVDQRRRQVLMHAAGPEIGGMKPRPAGPLVKDHQLFTFLEPPERRGQRAHVHRLRRHVQKVVEHPPDLAEQHPDERGPPRHDRPGQPFDGQTPGMFLVHRGDIVEPVEIGQVLQIGPALHQLLGTAVQKPDMRVAAFHHLSVQLKNQTKNSMRRRVLRAEIDVEVADLLLSGQNVTEILRAVHHPASPAMLATQLSGSRPIRAATYSYCGRSRVRARALCLSRISTLTP